MTRSGSPILPCAAALLALAACSKPAPPPEAPRPATSLANLPIADAPTPAPTQPQNTGDPAAFVPLRSDAVKDAIHRALRTGQTQRWADGTLTGYAVPSAQTDAHGCRAVRYTVDQRPAGTVWSSINACDANPAG